MGNKINALNKFHFCIVDENDNVITSGLRVSVFVAGSASAATIYADRFATSLTNPITNTVFATKVGKIEFWYGGGKVDVVISDGIGRLVAIINLTSSQNRVIFDSRLAVPGVIGNVTGTDLVDIAASFVEYDETVTLEGALLRAGDIIKIGGMLAIEDYNSTDTLDFKVQIVDGTNDPLILHTGDMSLVNDNDYMRFDMTVKVLVAGASGTILWTGQAFTSIANTLALLSATVHDGADVAGASLILNDDIVITALGDYSVTHADNESQIIWDVQVIKGVNYTT